MSKVLVVDNYDSFTWNLVQALGALGAEWEVRRNDRIRLREAERLKPDRILISPGPGRPENTGICADLVRRFEGKIPLLGVCLGHQLIAWCHGARIRRADKIFHGKTSLIHHDDTGLFRGLPNPFEAMRYHSLIVDPATLPETFLPTARTDRDEPMGIRHRTHPTEGVQFHPESYRTETGLALLRNFLNL